MSTKVAVIGLGAMGSAIAKTLIMLGYSVTVWNRTDAECKPLFAIGARIAPSFDVAAQRVDVLVTVMRSCTELEALLDSLGHGLNATDVINLTIGSPEQIRDLASQVRRLGGHLLSGTTRCSPEGIGREDAVVLMSGDAHVWDRHRCLLRTLAGRAFFMGEALSAALVPECQAESTDSLEALKALPDGGSVRKDASSPALARHATNFRSTNTLRQAREALGVSTHPLEVDLQRMSPAVSVGDAEHGAAVLPPPSMSQPLTDRGLI
ncbi:NAD(P)-binding domain-containing protein [Pseudomonas monteilii]|uniref:NAD(P)-dependent oxidoreductase n=1 Tax=Pseudomonas monteilii TaxID=76759 RepID=A0A399M901_9PSED|nr:NAD(P)-binding domain-containing protein [Pseudomonas monteilii]RII78258.1 NAD(P)-dependent oxidoreductase [Pseudomonas monteilii]